MSYFKKIAVSLYIIYLLLVFFSPSYIIHHCFSKQKTEVVKKLSEEFDKECRFCSHTDSAVNYIEASEPEEHSCCEQSRKSSEFEQGTVTENIATHKNHNELTSRCCSYSIVNVTIDYFSPEKIKEVHPLNSPVIYLSLHKLIGNPTEVLYSELPRQIRFPSKEFLSKLLTTIYFASLVG